MNEFSGVDIYAGLNPLRMPLYSYAEASRYLNVPPTTVRYWVQGGPYTVGGKRKRFEPVLSVTPEGGLSFLNLVELHTLEALRSAHRVRLEDVRKALEYARKDLGIERLLLSEDLQTHGREVFLRYYGDLLSLKRKDQFALENILEFYLQRVERDEQFNPTKLFPVVESAVDRSQRLVEINPRVAFGRPTIRGTSIYTGTVAERFDNGESVEELAADYAVEPKFIEGALLYEKAS